MNGLQKFQCCFCGKTIDPDSKNPGELAYTPGIGNHGRMNTQALYCHAECLASRLHPSAKLYVLDLDE